jgi:hypothetical protein
MEHTGIPEMQKMPAVLCWAYCSDEQRVRSETQKAFVRWNVEREIDLSLIVPTFLFKERHLRPLV